MGNEAVIKIRADDRSGKVLSKLRQNLENTASSARIVDGPLGGVASRLSSISSALGRVNPGLVAFGVGLTTTTLVMKSAITESAELEKQMFRLDALLNSTGNASGFTANQLNNMALRLGEATLASQTGARDAIGALLTFTSITGDSFERTLKSAQDLSAVLGTDLRSNVRLLARALEDPARGLNLLTRSGVVFTDQERENIQAMHDSGEAAKAQTLILDKLQSKIGGAGEGEAGGLAGAIDTLGERWTTFKTNIGDTSFIEGTIEGISRLLNLINTGVNPSTAQQLSELTRDLFVQTTKLNEARENGEGPGRVAALQKGIDALNAEIRVLNDAAFAEFKREVAIKNSAEASQIAKQSEADNLRNLDLMLDSAIAKERELEIVYKDQQTAIAKVSKEYEKLIQASLSPEESIASKLTQETEFFNEALNNRLISQEQHNIAMDLLQTNAHQAREELNQSRFEQEFALQERLRKIEEERIRRVAAVETANSRRVLSARKGFEGQVLASLQSFSSKSETIAKASIVVSKGLAIAQTIQSTEAAAIATLRNAAVVGADPVTASGQAQYIRGLGYASVGIIAGTGLGELSQVGGGGGGSGGGSVGGTVTPVATTPVIQSDQKQERTTQIVINNNFDGAFVGEDLTGVIAESVKDAVDSDRLIIDFEGQTADIYT